MRRTFTSTVMSVVCRYLDMLFLKKITFAAGKVSESLVKSFTPALNIPRADYELSSGKEELTILISHRETQAELSAKERFVASSRV